MQYLLNWRLFLLGEERKQFPATLCFPQFFYMSIISIITHYGIPQKDQRHPHIYNIIDKYYNDLESIVNIIFPGNEMITLIKPKEMKELLSKYETTVPQIFYLESFIKNEEDKQKYQNYLLSESLKFYKKTDLNEIISYLCQENCCSLEEIKEYPPPSQHYVTFNTNCSIKQLFRNNTFGPNIWGPYYWVIFHALAEKCPDEMVSVLDNYVRILPTIIPCEFCRMNYYIHICPSELPKITDKTKAKNLYSDVHAKVTNHTKKIIKFLK